MRDPRMSRSLALTLRPSISSLLYGLSTGATVSYSRYMLFRLQTRFSEKCQAIKTKFWVSLHRTAPPCSQIGGTCNLRGISI